jgi:hypothetical protein
MFCPTCGAPNDDDATFCGNCGAELRPEPGAVAGLVEERAAKEPAVTSETLGGMGGAAEVTTEPATGSLSGASGKVEAAGTRGEVRATSPSEAPHPGAAPGGRATQWMPSAPPTSGLAIASLVLGIGGLTVLPFLGSVAAIILGYMARQDIRRRPGQVSGDGLAVAGIVMGWIVVGASALVLVLSVLGIGASLCGVGLCGLTGTSW